MENRLNFVKYLKLIHAEKKDVKKSCFNEILSQERGIIIKLAVNFD